MITAIEPEVRECAPELPLPKSTVGIEEIAKKVSSLMALLGQEGPEAKFSKGDELKALARQLHRERRMRDKAIGASLFGEPGWDMLLYLFGSESEPVPLEAICRASAAAPTIGLRYLDSMLEKAWITRSSSPGEAEAVALTPSAKDRMKDLLETILADRQDRSRAGEAPDPHGPRSG